MRKRRRALHFSKAAVSCALSCLCSACLYDDPFPPSLDGTAAGPDAAAGARLDAGTTDAGDGDDGADEGGHRDADRANGRDGNTAPIDGGLRDARSNGRVQDAGTPGRDAAEKHDARAVDVGGPGCRPTPDPTEICDGLDNDCDGFIDVVPGPSGEPISKCKCDLPSPMVVSDARPDSWTPPLGSPECDTNGAATMDFRCDGDGGYNQCTFRGVKVETFDADHGHRGLLEVVFDLRDRVQGLGLSLWYGTYPRRKRLDLIPAEDRETAIAPGTHVVYFRPEDAACPGYTVDDERAAADAGSDAFADFPSGCLVEKNVGPGSACPGGRWGALDPACAEFGYDDTYFYLTAEYCTASIESVVSVLSIRLIDSVEPCKCRDDSSCASGQICHSEARVPAPWCDGGACAGVCSDVAACSGYGAPCTVIVGGKACSSRVVCSGHESVCSLPASCQ